MLTLIKIMLWTVLVSLTALMLGHRFDAANMFMIAYSAMTWSLLTWACR